MDIVWLHFIYAIFINISTFLFLGVAFITNYNKLTKLSEVLKQSWGQIEAQLQRRYDALLSMSTVVEGYAGHEQAIDAAVIKANSLIRSSGNMDARIQKSTEAERTINGFLGNVVQVATSFPDLKANSQFQQLLNTIQETGADITTRRESYNNTVREYNSFMKKFPTRMYAAYLGFEESKYFTFGETAKNELPEMIFTQQGVANGALAGSSQFPPESKMQLAADDEHKLAIEGPNDGPTNVKADEDSAAGQTTNERIDDNTGSNEK